ncbi:hypothetical protein, partial [Streptomyces sp. NPDC003247]|uniref:hypothetical protein n=1 Tax=Streptomyces sp. NPDC003247 TaxID=3364677 RepID=UPI0036C666F6
MIPGLRGTMERHLRASSAQAPVDEGCAPLRRRLNGAGPGRDVTPATFLIVTNEEQAFRWLILVIKLPADPSR